MTGKKGEIGKLRQEGGMVFQHFNVFPNMTVLQNIRCGIRSGSRAEKRRRAEEKLRRSCA